jgi:hypothetical protein
MSLPSIFIAPTRRARQVFAEHRDDIGGECFDRLRNELTAALLNAPQSLVSTPGYGTKQMPAAEVFLDDYAGIGSDARLHILVTLLADAAKGQDVQLRAMALIDDLGRRFAEFHVDDAVEQMEASL